MDVVERVSVPVQTRAEAGTTNAYVVGTDPAILVDPAAASPELEAALDGRRVGHVVVTHPHPDHVGAVREFAADATVWARQGYVERFVAATGVRPDAVHRQGTTIAASDTTVRVLETPGHAPDHVGLAVDDAVLTGDLVVAAGSVVVGVGEGDLRAYLTSLRRLHAMGPDRLYPGHGPVIDEPRRELARLVDHRLDRERRVEAAVAGGARTPEAIVDAAYEKDLDGVRDLARSTVVAHLRKLDAEGRVRWDGERARPA